MTSRALAAMIGVWLGPLAVVAASACPSDCDGDGRVVISELMLAVAIAQDEFPLRGCPQADANSDARVGVADLVASVLAALTGCPPPSPTATATLTAASTSTPTGTVTNTATATPVFDPQLPPTNPVDLIKWLEHGGYREWREVTRNGADHHDRNGTATFVSTFINEEMYASLACYDQPSHPVGASAVTEVWTHPDQEAPFGWSLSHKVRPDSDGGRGWYWYDYFGDAVRSVGRGVAECSSCHESGGGNRRIDYYASVGLHGGIRQCQGIPESDGGVCTALGLPPMATPYDGQIEYPNGAMRPATLYRGDEIFLEGTLYYPAGNSGLFNRRYCASSVPRPVRVEIEHTPDDGIVFAYYHLPSDQQVLRFRGLRRDD